MESETDTPPVSKLREALNKLPRGHITLAAAEIGCTATNLHQLASRLNGKVPGVKLSVAIERYFRGAVRRWDLRPDDWHECWPDLILEKGAPPVPTKQAA